MFKWVANLLCGYFVLLIPKELRGRIYDLMFRHGIEFFGEKNDKNGNLTLRLPRKYMELFVSEAASMEGWTCSGIRGFPVALRFMRNRMGITIGFVILLVWCFVSGRIVWDIRIEGNTLTPDNEIIELLDELGCGIGDWIPVIDYDDVHAKYLAMSDKIGWISVYMNGVVAEVQVRELVSASGEKPEEGIYANMVAGEDGVIEMVRVFEGQAAVKSGDIVRAGDVVISGVMEKKDLNLPDGGVRYEYAAGEVLAKTVRRIDVEIALEREEKVYTGRETVKKSVKIFGNVVNLFKNTGIDYMKYDKIDKMNRLSLWGVCDLPVWISETIYREYDYEIKEVPAEQAAAEGLTELRRLTDEATEGGEILEKSISTSLADGKYTIECLIYCLRDIAETVEFSVTD